RRIDVTIDIDGCIAIDRHRTDTDQRTIGVDLAAFFERGGCIAIIGNRTNAGEAGASDHHIAISGSVCIAIHVEGDDAGHAGRNIMRLRIDFATLADRAGENADADVTIGNDVAGGGGGNLVVRTDADGRNADAVSGIDLTVAFDRNGGLAIACRSTEEILQVGRIGSNRQEVGRIAIDAARDGDYAIVAADIAGDVYFGRGIAIQGDRACQYAAEPAGNVVISATRYGCGSILGRAQSACGRDRENATAGATLNGRIIDNDIRRGINTGRTADAKSQCDGVDTIGG